MEKRGAKYHRERLGEALREEIETIVEGELGDPRIGLASVSSVEFGSDSRSARIFVVVQGDDEEAERTLDDAFRDITQEAPGLIMHALNRSSKGF